MSCFLAIGGLSRFEKLYTSNMREKGKLIVSNFEYCNEILTGFEIISELPLLGH